MELLETDDPMKSQLLEKASRRKEGLEEDVKILSEKTEKMLINALVIGGALALTYFAVRSFSGSKKKSKRKVKKVIQQVHTKPVDEETDEVETESSGVSSMLSKVGTTLATQASVFLLAMAKDKLMEYLQSQAEKKADEHS